jgi:hypothetical protein
LFQRTVAASDPLVESLDAFDERSLDWVILTAKKLSEHLAIPLGELRHRGCVYSDWIVFLEERNVRTSFDRRHVSVVDRCRVTWSYGLSAVYCHGGEFQPQIGLLHNRERP